MNAFFNDDVLIEVGRDRGYANLDALAKGLSKVLDAPWKSVRNNIKSGRITVEDSFLIADWFAMTPKEYCDVFLNGLFVIDENGHYVARVDDPAYIRKPNRDKPTKEELDERKEAKREAVLLEILTELETM